MFQYRMKEKAYLSKLKIIIFNFYYETYCNSFFLQTLLKNIKYDQAYLEMNKTAPLGLSILHHNGVTIGLEKNTIGFEYQRNASARTDDARRILKKDSESAKPN